jgi:hypothetical protein
MSTTLLWELKSDSEALRSSSRNGFKGAYDDLKDAVGDFAPTGKNGPDTLVLLSVKWGKVDPLAVGALEPPPRSKEGAKVAPSRILTPGTSAFASTRSHALEEKARMLSASKMIKAWPS